MAYYQKRGKKWQARISWYENGKRKFKNKSGFPTKTSAKKWAVENEAKLNIGINIKKSISFVKYYDHWVKTYKEPQVTDVTLNRYNVTRKPLSKFFGDRSIKDITRSQYQDFINQYGSNHAPHTVHEVNNIVRACVRSAILDDYLIKDFTQGVNLVSDKGKQVNVDYLNLKEINSLLNACIKGIDHKSTYTARQMIITAIYTGMRLSEIQALTWNDIDWMHQTITINKSWNMYTHSFKATKNESSNRVIKVNQELLKILSELKAKHISNMVFMTQFGTVPTSAAVNKVLRKLLSNLGINRRNFHFHSLRHSHVALLLADGIDLYTIGKRLGHSDMRTTANTYAYLLDEYKKKTDNQIIDALDKLGAQSAPNVRQS